GLGLHAIELRGLGLGLGERARRGLELVGLPLVVVPVLRELQLPLAGELGAAAVLDRAARLPGVDRLLAGLAGRRGAALLLVGRGGVVLRRPVVILVAGVAAVARAPAIERVDHREDVALLAIDPGDRPLRAVLLAAIGLDPAVLGVEL